MIPLTAKAEWHLTYRCSLACSACSRASFLRRPHTEDMTLADAEEWCRQADAIGWRDLRSKYGERPRIILIGGEPTLHPDLLAFAKLAREWSGTFVQIFSNMYTEKTREVCQRAQSSENAAICSDGAKPNGSVTGPEMFPGWWGLTFVSPADAGLPSPPCYVHPTEICGFSVDHDGYAMCAIGGSVRAVLGLPRTKRFADLFDPVSAARMTAEECQHCGYEYGKRPVPQDVREQFMAYAESCPTVNGCRMSPTWQRAFEGRETK